jgi:threonine 3-dehydrogenase
MIKIMKALVKIAETPGLEYIEIEKPIPKPNEVLIEVEASAICGTDIHYYHWDQTAIGFGSKFNIRFPFVIGHECAGTIIAVGSAVTNRKVGQRVSIETHIPCGTCFACQNGMSHNCINMRVYGTSCSGCFAQYTTVDADVTFVLPDEISFEEGALLEPAGVAMRAVEECNINFGDTVVVNGCGPIGLIAIKILRVSGVSRVIAVDLDEYRLMMAENFGAIPINVQHQDATKAVLNLTRDRGGADVVIEMSGASIAYNIIFEMIRKEGRIVTVGHPSDAVTIDIMKSINLKGTSLKGIFGRRIWNTWWNLSTLIVSQKLDILDVVTHRFAFSEYSKAFDQISKGSGKVLFVKEK